MAVLEVVLRRKLDPACMQKIFDIAKRQRDPDVEHRGEADNLGTRLEVLVGGALGHAERLADRTVALHAKVF